MKPIQLTGDIVINTDHKTVFSYLSNYSNDKYWRKEINETTLNTAALEIGTLLTEDSFLSKRNPNYVSYLKCMNLEPNKTVSCETTSTAAFWALNKRTVEAIEPNKTKVIYHLEFDPAIVKFGIGFQLPRFFLNFYTRTVMKDYLNVLKKNLEKWSFSLFNIF